MSDASERCWLCAFWNGSRCTQTWRLMVHVEPNGGQVDFSTTPGMVPEHLKEKLSEMFGRMVTLFLLPLIEKMPVWEEIKEFQTAKPERMDCPAKQEIAGLHPYLKVVKNNPGVLQ
jgi:hypothetical protein